MEYSYLFLYVISQWRGCKLHRNMMYERLLVSCCRRFCWINCNASYKKHWISNDARHQALGITNTCYERTSFSIIWVTMESAQIRPDLNSISLKRWRQQTNTFSFIAGLRTNPPCWSWLENWSDFMGLAEFRGLDTIPFVTWVMRL